MIGDYLYQLTRKDHHTQPVIQRLSTRITAAAAAATVQAVGPVIPPEKVGILTWLNVQATGGGAQTVSGLSAFIRVDGVTISQVLLNYVPPTAVVQNGWQETGHQLLFPGEQLIASVNYSAAVAVNTTDLSFHILLLPKGNLQLR